MLGNYKSANLWVVLYINLCKTDLCSLIDNGLPKNESMVKVMTAA